MDNDKFSIRQDAGTAKNEGINSYISNNIKDKTTYTYQTGKVSRSLAENRSFIDDAFNLPKNFDLMLREFSVRLGNCAVDAFLIFFDGLSNTNYINRDILRPLMTADFPDATATAPREEIVYQSLITQAPNKKLTEMKQIIELVSFGNCAIFVDGCSCAFVADVKGWEGRPVGKPITESTLSGPQEAFNEKIMTNIGLVRKILKDPNTVAELVTVGTTSKTPCALMYINGITNKSLVGEIRRRLKSIDTEYIFSSADIEMFIEESSFIPLPQILKTERPDRAAAMLSDGKAILIVQGSPFALVLPGTAPDLLETSEDNYVRTTEANFMKLVRLGGIFTALFLPGFFLSLMLYHHESIPTDLLFAIEASREKMPFPLVVELTLMLLAFELIKEASIRVPGPIGSTLGIVGGLILGQSAVSAGIASPLLIIIVSISALGAFAAPSLSLSRAISVMQFVFIILGYFAGFLGIATGIFLLTLHLSSLKVMGVPYLSPFTTKSSSENGSPLIVKPIWKRERRPSALHPQRGQKQPHISRKWKY